MKKVYIAGHRGLVGSALCRALAPHSELITRQHSELDLTDKAAVSRFLAEVRPDEIYLAAAKVGGIVANRDAPADFIYQNLAIALNVIDAAHEHGIGKLLFLGSSCIYPRLAEQPIVESALLTGHLEETNDAYAIAKIAGIKMCEAYRRQHGRDYRSVMPTNLYGLGDNYHPSHSHVIPGLIRRFHEAKQANAPFVEIWGTGNVKREFLYSDDLAAACVHVMNLPEERYWSAVTPHQSHINVGTGVDMTIRELAGKIRDVVGYVGELRFDTSKPDGTPRKCLDVSLLHSLGFVATTHFETGLRVAYDDFLTRESTR